MDEITELIQLLDAYFGDLRVPPEDCLVDDFGYDQEASEIRDKFRQRHWKDLTIEDLAGEADALSFFTPEAFRFFLPAFIRVSILHWERAGQIPDVILWSLVRPDTEKWWADRQALLLQTAWDHHVPEDFIHELAPQKDSEADARAARRRSLLDDEQKYTILKFVSFLRKYYHDDFRFGELELVEVALRTKC